MQARNLTLLDLVVLSYAAMTVAFGIYTVGSGSSPVYINETSLLTGVRIFVGLTAVLLGIACLCWSRRQGLLKI